MSGDCLDQEVVLFCSPGPADDFFRHGIWSRGIMKTRNERIPRCFEGAALTHCPPLLVRSTQTLTTTRPSLLSTRNVPHSRILFWRGRGLRVAHKGRLWTRLTPCHKETARGDARTDVGYSTLCPTRTLGGAQPLGPALTIGYSNVS